MAYEFRVVMILSSNYGLLKNIIRYDEVNHGKIDNTLPGMR